ncbi:hypothetical protein C0992_005718 [Termitomyces sp. T32_za158]|nr:hypothetical protein C0992_005718 [Termitomyces sp. T32_za158]
MARLGFKVASIFASFGGPQISFLLPTDADCFMALGLIEVPAKVSKHLARIEPLKEVPVERAFELVVSGARDFNDLWGPLESWIRKVAPSLLAHVCTTELNLDLVIFLMKTWAATLLILKSEETLRKRFPKNVLLPRLLWDYNNNPLRKATLGDQFSKGAKQVSGTMRALQNEVQDMRGQLKSVQDQQASMLGHQSKMINFMNNIDSRMKSTQQAITIQGKEIAIRAQLAEMESRIRSLQVGALLSPDPARRVKLERAIKELAASVEGKRAELLDNTD